MILITGGSGFFGGYLINRFRSAGNPVRILDLLPLDESIDGTETINGDVCDSETAKKACEGVRTVIHNAALVPLSHAGHRYWDVNVEGTRTMIEAAIAMGVQKFVFISSSSVYGVPIDGQPITEETPLAPFETYGKSKAAAEEICQAAKDRIDISIVRPRTILGPGRMGLMSLLFDWVQHNHRVYILGSGRNVYQLVSATDLAEAVYRVSTEPCRGEDFNIGTASFSALRGDLETFIQHAGSRSKVISVPGWLARSTLPFLGAIGFSPFASYHYHIADKSVSFNMEKTKRLLHFVPAESNADMLLHAYEWFRSHPDIARLRSPHKKKMSEGMFKLLRYIP